MENIVPCDDCGKPIDIGRLGVKGDRDKFVCKKCRKKYSDMESLVAMIERKATTVH